MSARPVVLAAVLALGASGSARAQMSLPGGFPPSGEGPTQEEGVLDTDDPPPTWAYGRKRFFVGGAFDLGFLYIRPRFQLGWGRPHARWVGLDINPIVSPNAIGGYGGFRIDHPYVDWRLGARFALPFARSYMIPQEDFDRGDLNRDVADEDGYYLSIESELTITAPAGHGNLFSETALTYVTLVPEDRFVYEDTIKVIVDPPWIWRERIGYMARFGENDAVRVGLALEMVGVPERDLIALRGGILLRIWVSPRVEIRGAWVPAIIHRDELGVNGGDFGLLGLRYRWSTGGVTGRQEGVPAVLPEFREDEEAPAD